MGIDWRSKGEQEASWLNQSKVEKARQNRPNTRLRGPLRNNITRREHMLGGTETFRPEPPGLTGLGPRIWYNS